MKSKLILMGAVVVVLLFPIACSPQASQSVQHLVNCDAFMNEQHISGETEVSVGGSLTVVLCSNPTTGFQWETSEISDQTVLEQVDHKFVSPESDPPPPPGTPGQEVWTFKALKEGESTISTAYSRPWEGGEKAEWTFTLTVVVK